MRVAGELKSSHTHALHFNTHRSQAYNAVREISIVDLRTYALQATAYAFELSGVIIGKCFVRAVRHELVLRSSSDVAASGDRCCAARAAELPSLSQGW